MRIRVRQPAVLMAVGLALSGCIYVECPAEFARPADRERFCGHQGHVAAPVTYRQNYAPMPPPQLRPAAVMPVPETLPPGPPSAAPVGPPVSVEPVPPAPRSGPTTIR